VWTILAFGHLVGVEMGVFENALHSASNGVDGGATCEAHSTRGMARQVSGA